MSRNLIRTTVALVMALSILPTIGVNAASSSTTSVRDLQVSELLARSVHLSWLAPAWGTDGVTDYQVEYKAASGNSWTTFGHTASTDTGITITGLTAGQSYNFRVSPVITSVVQPAKTLGIKQIAVGMSHACALSDAGEVSCWGDNSFGQLGNSDTSITSSSSALRISGLTATSITAGRDHTCALITDGTIKCWGSNTNGQLGTGDTSYQLSATPRQVSGITNATTVSAGAMHVCAVVDNGAVKCWGAGAKYRLGLASSYGQNDVSTPTSVAGLTGLTAIQVTGGTSQSCALLSTKAVKCWGDNASGQLGAGATSSATPSPRAVSGIDGSTASAAQISMGSQHACAVLTDGTAKCWGNGGSGRIGNGATTTAATPATVKMGNNTLTGIRSIAAGAESSCAVINSGEVVCWGNNAAGQLGNGALVSQSQAVSTGIANAIAVAADLGSNVAGTGHNCALLSDSSVKCWGTGTSFVLGNGSTASSSTPVSAAVGVASAITPVGAPEVPEWASVTQKLRSLVLNWITPANNGSALTAISLKYSGGAKDGQVACTPVVTDTSCTITDLNPLFTYSFALAASNALGTSSVAISPAYSTQTSGTTDGWNWQDSTNSMTITGCLTSCDNVVIPRTLVGDSVTSIGSSAFTSGLVVSVALPHSVSSIATDSFGTQKLPLTNLTTFGTQINGSATVGSALTVSGTGWLATASKQYAWLRDGQAITGATKSRYVPTSDDFGKSIAAVVTLRKTGYIATTLTSSGIVINAGNLPATSTPRVSGVFRIGRTLTAATGTWSTGTAFTYRWLSGGTPVPDASQSTYTLGLTDLGKSISVEITGSKFGYVSRTRTSVGHDILPGIQSAITGLGIIGSLKVGQELTSSLVGAQYSFQWLRGGAVISGATSSSYTATVSDIGRYLSLRVTRAQSGYLNTTKTVKASTVTIR